MPCPITRRRDPDDRQERWRVFYGDVQVGTIGMRSGVPVDVDQWDWSCAFYPVSDRDRLTDAISTLSDGWVAVSAQNPSPRRGRA